VLHTNNYRINKGRKRALASHSMVHDDVATENYMAKVLYGVVAITRPRKEGPDLQS
jgi:hypothetical protein